MQRGCGGNWLSWTYSTGSASSNSREGKQQAASEGCDGQVMHLSIANFTAEIVGALFEVHNVFSGVAGIFFAKS
ncbi:hypothetical protein E2C01_002492 [Portunus trituberculatus]|uniref:Uncharacterized protein n=1 Tax=Portunus trituberculatus TaxID=210409 RepID=A0A5B7CME5_PORTR|nr:hypothetical protein [Portunus trituberculatus]